MPRPKKIAEPVDRREEQAENSPVLFQIKIIAEGLTNDPVGSILDIVSENSHLIFYYDEHNRLSAIGKSGEGSLWKKL